MFPEDLTDHEVRMKNYIKDLMSGVNADLKKKGGGKRWFIVSVHTLLDSHDVFDGSFGMFTDITELK